MVRGSPEPMIMTTRLGEVFPEERPARDVLLARVFVALAGGILLLSALPEPLCREDRDPSRRLAGTGGSVGRPVDVAVFAVLNVVVGMGLAMLLLEPLRFCPELKGSIGEGPNHSNHSNSFKRGIFPRKFKNFRN